MLASQRARIHSNIFKLARNVKLWKTTISTQSFFSRSASQSLALQFTRHFSSAEQTGTVEAAKPESKSSPKRTQKSPVANWVLAALSCLASFFIFLDCQFTDDAKFHLMTQLSPIVHRTLDADHWLSLFICAFMAEHLLRTGQKDAARNLIFHILSLEEDDKSNAENSADERQSSPLFQSQFHKARALFGWLLFQEGAMAWCSEHFSDSPPTSPSLPRHLKLISLVLAARANREVGRPIDSLSNLQHLLGELGLDNENFGQSQKDNENGLQQFLEQMAAPDQRLDLEMKGHAFQLLSDLCLDADFSDQSKTFQNLSASAFSALSRDPMDSYSALRLSTSLNSAENSSPFQATDLRKKIHRILQQQPAANLLQSRPFLMFPYSEMLAAQGLEEALWDLDQLKSLPKSFLFDSPFAPHASPLSSLIIAELSPLLSQNADQCLALSRQALFSNLKNYGSIQSPHCSRALCNLANLHLLKGDTDTASALFSLAVENCMIPTSGKLDDNEEPENQSVFDLAQLRKRLEICSNRQRLAEILRAGSKAQLDTQNPSKAEEWLSRSNHPTSLALSFLASFEAGHLAKAHEKILEFTRIEPSTSSFPLSIPDQLSHLQTLAIIHSHMGRYKEASEISRQIIALFETSLGLPDHPALVRALEIQSRAIGEMGNVEGGIELGVRAMKLCGVDPYALIGSAMPHPSASSPSPPQNMSLLTRLLTPIRLKDASAETALTDRSDRTVQEGLLTAHQRLPFLLNNTGYLIRQNEGTNSARANRLFELACESCEKQFGKDHAACRFIKLNVQKSTASAVQSHH